MKSSALRVVLVALLVLPLSPAPLLGYIGPGSGLSAIGALLAIVAGLFFAVFGFVWYPMKRLMRANRKTEGPVESVEETAPIG